MPCNDTHTLSTPPIPACWRLLQRDATLTAQDLGAVLNLSPSQAARRRQRLEQIGIITGYRATVAPDRIGLGVEAFIQVVMAAHSDANARDFRRLTDTRPEIIAAWTLTGEADYLLARLVRDLAALNTADPTGASAASGGGAGAKPDRAGPGETRCAAAAWAA